jgi:O-antigen/teichoic acid export membrane protein
MLLKQFFKESFLYGLATVLSRFLGVLLLPLYTNYLSPADFSNFTILQALFSVLTFFLTLVAGVMYYYYTYKSTKTRLRLFTTWFYFQLGILVPLGLLVLISFPILKQSFILTLENENNLFIFILLVFLQLIPYIFTNTALNSFRIARDAKNAVYISVLEAVVTTALSVVSLVFFKGGIQEILIAQILGRSITVLFFFKSCISFTKWENFSKLLLKKLLVYNWPYFFINCLTWFIVSVDKFMGSHFMKQPQDIALLAVGMQLVTPIVLFADMIRMALGPFIMDLNTHQSRQNTYQKIFDYSLFFTSVLSILLIIGADLLLYLLTNESFNRVLDILPLFCISQLFAVAINQVSIDFNLAKKNVHILGATLLGGIVGVVINYHFMSIYGMYAVACAQITAHMCVFVYLVAVGKHLIQLKIHLFHFAVFLVILSGFVYLFSHLLFDNQFSTPVSGYILGVVVILSLALYFWKSQKLKLIKINNQK